MPKVLIDFYFKTNGLSLGWIHKDDKSASYSGLREMKLPKDLDKLVSKKVPEYRASYTNQSGSIEIKGIRELFSSSFHMNVCCMMRGSISWTLFLMYREQLYRKKMLANGSSPSTQIINTHFDDYSNALTVKDYFNLLIESTGIKRLRNEKKRQPLTDSVLNTWPEEYNYYE